MSADKGLIDHAIRLVSEREDITLLYQRKKVLACRQLYIPFRGIVEGITAGSTGQSGVVYFVGLLHIKPVGLLI